MTKITHILALSLLLLLTSCDTGSMEFLDTPQIGGASDVVVGEDGKVEVLLPVSSGVVSTRTALDPNDLASVRWCVGDNVALWAKGVANSSTDLNGELFQLKYYSTTFDDADFSGSINPMSSDQEYDYFAFYPYTSEVSGSTVNYTIPFAQSGKYDGKLDFRVADTQRGKALTSTTFRRDLSLSFRSVTHILKITIPEGHNILGSKIKTLIVTMPTDVVGNLSVDTSKSGATPAFTANAHNQITVDLSDDPIDAGDGKSVWLFINPAANVTGDITIEGIGVDNRVSVEYAIPLTNHTFAAGRITPINAEIGKETARTSLQVTIKSNKLGEPITNVNFTAPQGGVFYETGTNTMSVKSDGTNIYKVSYYTDQYSSKFKAGALGVTMESDQALVPIVGGISLAKVVDNQINNYDQNIGEVLNQNFDSMKSFEHPGFNEPVGKTEGETGQGGYVWLNEYGSLSSAGWAAARSGSNGDVVGICCRIEKGLGADGTYEGRLNSPALSVLKSGAKVKVSYVCAGNYFAKQLHIWVIKNWWDNYTSSKVMYQRGYFTGDSNPSINDDIASIVGSDGVSVVTKDVGGVTKDMQVSTSWVDKYTYYAKDKYTHKEYYISNASSSTRLAWRVWGKDVGFGNGNANFWLYIDNVVVTIVPKSKQ